MLASSHALRLCDEWKIMTPNVVIFHSSKFEVYTINIIHLRTNKDEWKIMTTKP